MHGNEFVRRFLQHVLPKGLHKVRYFGLWHPSKRHRAAQARLLLELERKTEPATEPAASSLLKVANQSAAIATEPRRCPSCGRGHLVYIRRLTPKNALGPWPTSPRFQPRLSLLSLLRASLNRQRLLRPADQIILLSAFNKRSTDLRCPASKPPKSVATDQSALVSAEP